MSKIALAILPVLAVLGQSIRVRGLRAQIKYDAEILTLLPSGSAVHDRLLLFLDRSVERLEADSELKSRDPVGIGLATAFLLAAVVAATFAVQGDGWWWWLVSIPFGLFGLVGLASSASKVTRDERGREIKTPTSAIGHGDGHAEGS